MNQSVINSKANIHMRMLAIMAEAQAIPKNGVNEYSHYNYVRAVDVVAEVQKLLVKHGVYVTISEMEQKRERFEGQKGVQYHTTIKCCAEFHNVDVPAEFIEVEYYATAADSLDKDIYKAKTGGMKYLFTQAFLIVTDALADPEEERAQPQRPQLRPVEREPGDDRVDDMLMDDAPGPSPQRKAAQPQPSARTCPKCGKKMIIGKLGKSLYCVGYSDKTCNYKEPLSNE